MAKKSKIIAMLLLCGVAVVILLSIYYSNYLLSEKGAVHNESSEYRLYHPHPGLFGLELDKIPCMDSYLGLRLSGVAVHEGSYYYLLATSQGINRTEKNPLLIENFPVMARESESVTLDKNGKWFRLCLHQYNLNKKSRKTTVIPKPYLIDTPLLVFRGIHNASQNTWVWKIDKCKKNCLSIASVGISVGDIIMRIDGKYVLPSELSATLKNLTNTRTTHVISVSHLGRVKEINLSENMIVYIQAAIS